MQPKYRVFCGDAINFLSKQHLWDYVPFQCAFADPPDNIGLKYNSYDDDIADDEYIHWMKTWLRHCLFLAQTTWVSFNAKWTIDMGVIANDFLCDYSDLKIKPCTQVFTFGQHNQRDLGSGHRPLWRFMFNAPLYPDQIRVPSWRQENGDSRADPRGRVPCDVFDFPRVTGNSRQRRVWHPTQLHESLVERCILLSTKEGDSVLDLFSGTGTTMRVCKRINRSCTSIEIDPDYAARIAEENQVTLF